MRDTGSHLEPPTNNACFHFGLSLGRIPPDLFLREWSLNVARSLVWQRQPIPSICNTLRTRLSRLLQTRPRPPSENRLRTSLKLLKRYSEATPSRRWLFKEHTPPRRKHAAPTSGVALLQTWTDTLPLGCVRTGICCSARRQHLPVSTHSSTRLPVIFSRQRLAQYSAGLYFTSFGYYF
jgi:hypothetical protein